LGTGPRGMSPCGGSRHKTLPLGFWNSVGKGGFVLAAILGLAALAVMEKWTAEPKSEG
jgi:hypothetical protein